MILFRERLLARLVERGGSARGGPAPSPAALACVGLRFNAPIDIID
jgi:hypothetical protein